MKLFLTILLAFSVSTLMADANDNQSDKGAQKQVKKELSKGPNHGKPDDPGAKGQANAAYKKATNPGKGSGKNKDLEVTPLNEVLKDDKKNKDGSKKKRQKQDIQQVLRSHARYRHAAVPVGQGRR